MFGPVSDKSETRETDSLKWKWNQNGSYLVSYTPGLIMHGQPLKWMWMDSFLQLYVKKHLVFHSEKNSEINKMLNK